jgi:hypothetical protein
VTVAPSSPDESARDRLRASRRRWWWGWTAAVVLSIILSLIAIVLIVAGKGAACGEPPTSRNRSSGLAELAFAAAVLAMPWAIATFSSRAHRRRVLIGALIGLAPLLLFVATHLTVRSWVGGVCLF